jgi:predicted amidophosphoribosyltransferase
MPLHPTRLRQRGYNQALELARPLASAMDVPVRLDLLLRTRATRAQTDLGAIARRLNVRDAFTVKAGVAWPGHVALLDDVMTTGATLAEGARVLRRAGVRRIDIWALARAPTSRV